MSTETALQIREHVIEPALRAIDLWSPAAVRLVMGTGAHESAGFKYIHQLAGGPALSWFQIEPTTHDDFYEHSMPGLERSRPETARLFRAMIPQRFGSKPPAEYLLHNQLYAAAMCRLLYWRVPKALPYQNNIKAMAAYWKEFYNTEHGSGTEEQWLEAYAENFQ